MLRRVLLLLLALPVAAAELTLEFEPRWNGERITVPSAVVANASGQSLRITRFAAIISDISLIKTDGSTVLLPGQYGFIDAGSGRLQVPLENVPAGDFAGIAFQFGVPVDVNHAAPDSWPAEHPLNPLVNRLHWNWKGGYVFVALEGRWADARAGSPEFGFSYHVAGDEHRMPIRFAAQFAIAGPTTIQLAVDLAKVLLPTRLAQTDGSDNTHSATGDPVAERVALTLRRSVYWLGDQPTTRVGSAATHPAPNDTKHASPDRAALSFRVPAGFPVPRLPQDNPLTNAGIALGQALFTDARLSGTGTQSCADCHSARHAFSDTVALSRGADGHPGVRNAMPLFNLAWSSSFAWDGSKPRIRDQALAAMTNPVEMHGEPARIIARLAADPAMVTRFEAAFGTGEITLERICLALEQCLLTNVSADSKFDRSVRGEVALTEEEKEGFALFMTEFDPARGRRGADCFHCHGGPLFTDFDFKNTGLDAMSRDPARQAVTGLASDAGKFKTPSLRNVAVTAPYMHDGRFATLEEVVAHYDHGVVRTATLDPNLAKHPDAGLNLTSAEQRALVAFLRTLTDPRWESASAPPR